MKYYSAIKKNTFESVLMRWMKLKPIIQTEVSQKETPWNSSGKNAGVGCHSLLQGIFLTEVSNSGLLHYRCFLSSEPPGKPYRVYGLQIFLPIHRSTFNFLKIVLSRIMFYFSIPCSAFFLIMPWVSWRMQYQLIVKRNLVLKEATLIPSFKILWTNVITFVKKSWTYSSIYKLLF